MKPFFEKKFIIFGNPAKYYIQAYRDVLNTDFCRYIPNGLDNNNRLLLFLYQLNFSKKLNSILRIHKLRIWNKMSFKNQWNEDPNYFLIFNSKARNFYENSYIQYLRKKYPKAKIIIFCQDLISANSSEYDISYFKDNSDLILSFDQGEAQKYDLVYYPLVYSKMPVTNIDITYDLSFVGGAKNRLNDIISVWEYCTSHNITCDFHVVGVPSKKQKYREQIHYRKSVSYQEYLDIMHKSNCVLEVMQKNGRGSTIRLAESVMCNRKLLTNNVDVMNHNAFTLGYISQFNKPEDIDLDFVKRRENVDYSSVQESFSPLKLLEFIDDYFREKNNL